MTPNFANLTGLTKLTGELKKAPKARKEKKVKDSALGIVVIALALPVLAFTGFLALRPNPSLVVLGGGAGIGMVLLAFGALIADKETVLPVLRAMVGLVIKARK